MNIFLNAAVEIDFLSAPASGASRHSRCHCAQRRIRLKKTRNILKSDEMMISFSKDQITISIGPADMQRAAEKISYSFSDVSCSLILAASAAI